MLSFFSPAWVISEFSNRGVLSIQLWLMSYHQKGFSGIESLFFKEYLRKCLHKYNKGYICPNLQSQSKVESVPIISPHRNCNVTQISATTSGRLPSEFGCMPIVWTPPQVPLWNQEVIGESCLTASFYLGLVLKSFLSKHLFLPSLPPQVSLHQLSYPLPSLLINSTCILFSLVVHSLPLLQQ